MILNASEFGFMEDRDAKKAYFSARFAAQDKGPIKYVAGPKNQACVLVNNVDRHFNVGEPKNIFTESMNDLDLALLQDDKDEVNKAMVTCAGNIRDVMKRIYGKADLKTAKEFTGSLLPRILPLTIREKTAKLITAVISRYPKLIDKADDPAIMSIASAYVDRLKVMDAESRPRIERATRQAVAILLTASRQKRIPVSEERIMDTVERIQIDMQDPLVNHIDESTKIDGEYDPVLHHITVDMTADDDVIVESILHELIHALEGRTYRVNLEKNDANIVRGGYRFVNPEASSERQKSRFGWLNEGVTELITNSLSIPGLKGTHPKFKHSYYDEKFLCAEIFYGLPDMHTLVDAYFEDYDETKAGTPDNLPAWKSIQRFLKEKYGPNFLVNLDDFIKKEDVETALMAIRKYRKNFSEVLRLYLAKTGRDVTETPGMPTKSIDLHPIHK
jgi:hypothetical protein